MVYDQQINLSWLNEVIFERYFISLCCLSFCWFLRGLFLLPTDCCRQKEGKFHHVLISAITHDYYIDRMLISTCWMDRSNTHAPCVTWLIKTKTPSLDSPVLLKEMPETFLHFSLPLAIISDPHSALTTTRSSDSVSCSLAGAVLAQTPGSGVLLQKLIRVHRSSFFSALYSVRSSWSLEISLAGRIDNQNIGKCYKLESFFSSKHCYR